MTRHFTMLVFTDGRGEYLDQTIMSHLNAIEPVFDEVVIVNDCEDPTYAEFLEHAYPPAGFEYIHNRERLGFCGTIQNAWDHLTNQWCYQDDYVWHVEDDFLMNGVLNLNDLADELDANEHLQQIALLRQPCNDEERRAGGVIQARDPRDFTQRARYIEHNLFWTTNPSLYRRSLCSVGWPDGPYCEGKFGFELRAADPGTVFGYWGRLDDPPKVHHIGEHRIGTGY